MNGRQRLSRLYHGRLADRVPWTPLINATTLETYPDEVRELGPVGFAKMIGGDVLHRAAIHRVEHRRVRFEQQTDGPMAVSRTATPWGDLTETRRAGRLFERRIKSLADYDAYRDYYEDQRFTIDEQAHRDAERLVGDDGIVTVSIGPTPVQHLVEFDLGIDGFAYHLADHARELEALMAAMHAKNLDLYHLVAASPAEFIMLYENTSTTMISPAIYKRYSVEHVKGFVDAVRARGKVAIVHMCGKVGGLLPAIKRTGLDAVDCLTPSPTGDTDFGEAIRVWGPGVTIHGVLDPSKWTHRPIAEVERHIDDLLTPDVLRHPFVFATAADGLSGIAIEKFKAIGRIMERYGRVVDATGETE